MAQADQTVQNATFPAVRSDINNNLAALFSCNSGNIAPTTTVAFMDWIDTSGADPVWKKRNSANSGWITIGTIKTSTLELAAANVLPSQTGNSGKYLTTDGTVTSWGIVPPGSTKEVFTSSGTWTKPSTGTIAYIEIWSGGGGGGRGASTPLGGGGGAYRWAFAALSELSATVTITIGSGGTGATVSGTAGQDGGDTSFGSYIKVFGAEGGGSSTSTGQGGYWKSGGYVDLSGVDKNEGAGTTLWVGGRGGSSTAVGSSSVHGGAGGGGTSTTVGRAGGTSSFGGNGGAGAPTGGIAGSIPGGGGGAGVTGNGGNGARGEVRVYVW